MAETITGKIKRRFMASYVDAAPPSESKESYVRLGKGLEEYIVETNANVGTKNNTWGEMSVTLDSYQPQTSVELYRTEVGEPLFEHLQEIVDEQWTLDDLEINVVEAHLWDPVEVTDDTYVTYKESVIIEVSSCDGDMVGYQIPFNVRHSGNGVKGKFTPATKTFTADTWAEAQTAVDPPVVHLIDHEEVEPDGEDEESIIQ